MSAKDIAQKYFEVSNRSDFSEIEKFFSETSTYSSQNTGLYLGRKNILEMQKNFHNSFESLNWKIDKIVEEKSGIIRVDFDFEGMKDGEKVEFSGIEYVVVVENIIQHIEIRNK